MSDTEVTLRVNLSKDTQKILQHQIVFNGFGTDVTTNSRDLIKFARRTISKITRHTEEYDYNMHSNYKDECTLFRVSILDLKCVSSEKEVVA